MKSFSQIIPSIVPLLIIVPLIWQLFAQVAALNSSFQHRIQHTKVAN